MTWLDITERAVYELGGKAHLKDIYAKVEEILLSDEFKNNPKRESKDIQAIIRGTIECNSSDSEKYNNKNDIFYSVSGKGKGEWGLRDFKFNDYELNAK